MPSGLYIFKYLSTLYLYISINRYKSFKKKKYFLHSYGYVWNVEFVNKKLCVEPKVWRTDGQITWVIDRFIQRSCLQSSYQQHQHQTCFFLLVFYCDIFAYTIVMNWYINPNHIGGGAYCATWRKNWCSHHNNISLIKRMSLFDTALGKPQKMIFLVSIVAKGTFIFSLKIA